MESSEVGLFILKPYSVKLLSQTLWKEQIVENMMPRIRLEEINGGVCDMECVTDRIMTLKDAHVLIPGICKYNTVHSKRDFNM